MFKWFSCRVQIRFVVSQSKFDCWPVQWHCTTYATEFRGLLEPVEYTQMTVA